MNEALVLTLSSQTCGSVFSNGVNGNKTIDGSQSAGKTPGFPGKLSSKAQELGPPSGTKGRGSGAETSKLEMADG